MVFDEERDDDVEVELVEFDIVEVGAFVLFTAFAELVSRAEATADATMRPVFVGAGVAWHPLYDETCDTRLSNCACSLGVIRVGIAQPPCMYA